MSWLRKILPRLQATIRKLAPRNLAVLGIVRNTRLSPQAILKFLETEFGTSDVPALARNQETDFAKLAAEVIRLKICECLVIKECCLTTVDRKATTEPLLFNDQLWRRILRTE